MNIMVVSANYPSSVHPTRGLFVYNLVQEFCRQGATVTTIAPLKVWDRLKNERSHERPDLSRLLRPYYVSFSAVTICPGVTTGRLGLTAMARAVEREATRVEPPDVVYGHFMFPGGFSALRVSQRLRVPSVVALGESSMERVVALYGFGFVRQLLHKFSRIITVSGVLRDFCVDRVGVDSRKVAVIPNAVDAGLFYPRERLVVRRKLGLPEDAFIVAYLGRFSERKGYQRLLAALKYHPQAKAIFIGDGPIYPQGEQVLFAGPIDHSNVPEWLAAADIFALPTLAEGNCNAVNEALAVGLPVVVSDIPALREQVSERSAVFVDPRSVNEIARGIGELLFDPKKREAMAIEAERIGKDRTLHGRARTILQLLESVA